jgi:hypothetical protein
MPIDQIVAALIELNQSDFSKLKVKPTTPIEFVQVEKNRDFNIADAGIVCPKDEVFVEEKIGVAGIGGKTQRCETKSERSTFKQRFEKVKNKIKQKLKNKFKKR